MSPCYFTCYIETRQGKGSPESKSRCVRRKSGAKKTASRENLPFEYVMELSYLVGAAGAAGCAGAEAGVAAG